MTDRIVKADAIADAGKEPHTYQYPFAASPDIIRSNQKDSYFQAVLYEQVTSILRKIYGARTLHNISTEARVASDMLYLGLTTLVGNRTLGEEYCDIVQVEDDTLRLPTISRRAGYILTTILLPYGLNRVLPALRRRVRAKLEAILARPRQKSDKPTRGQQVQQYVLDNLDTLTSTAPVYAVSLATFYFTGAYYHLAKRMWGLRYIFTRELQPADQRVGYEVLGVLLVLQLSVQTWMHLHDTYKYGPTRTPDSAGARAPPQADATAEIGHDPIMYTGNNALLAEAAASPSKLGKIAAMTHTPPTTEDSPRIDLEDRDLMRWLGNRQARKCTLCLEAMKDPSTTTCGHVFCWTCICDWCREKPECPLCRQGCTVQHILPLRG